MDIKNDISGQPYIFSIEDGEWLLYTISVKKAENYSLNFNTSGTDGIINVYNNNKIVAENISVATTADEDQFVKSPAIKIHLNKGIIK